MEYKYTEKFDQYNFSLKNAIITYRDTIELMQKYDSAGTRNEVKELKDLIKSLLIQDCRVPELKNISQKLERNMEENPALDISSAFDKIVENTSYDFTTSQYYHLVLPLFEDNILVIEQDINLICPLTKSKLVDPVISTKCSGSHRFSKSAITLYLQTNSACPISGCNKRLTLRDLKEDTEAIKLLESRKNN